MPCELSDLPPEILGLLAKWLPLEDFKSLRLTSRHIAHSLQPFLAQPVFAGLPWKKDAQRLLALTKIPACKGRIKSLHYLFGKLDQRAVLFADRHDSERNQRHELENLSEEASAEQIEKLKEAQATRKKHWAAYYQTVNEGKRNGPFHHESFAEALKNLPSLDDLILTWSECPYKEQTIKDIFDADESIYMAKDDGMGEIQQLALNKLWELDIPLKSLTLEPMAFHDLTLPSGPMPQQLFETLEHFHIEAIAELFEQKRLEYLLMAMKNLKRFCLQFVGNDHTAFDLDFLPNTTLPNLEFFSVTCAECSLDSLADFLRRHKQLHSVALCHMRGLNGEDGMPTTTQWEDIFKLLREEFTLKTVDIEGVFAIKRGERVEFWKPDSAKDFGGQQDSSEVERNPMPQNNPNVIPSSVIEDWILKGGEFPELPWMDYRAPPTGLAGGFMGDMHEDEVEAMFDINDVPAAFFYNGGDYGGDDEHEEGNGEGSSMP